MTTIRSHFAPDNIEGIMVGDKVYFHITNLEQDYDVPHGISMIGANTSELLIMPGQTETFVWVLIPSEKEAPEVKTSIISETKKGNTIVFIGIYNGSINFN